VTPNAARVLTCIADVLALDCAVLAEVALQADPGADSVVLIPYFEGERTLNLPHATATFKGSPLRQRPGRR
jgi:xylulokinase